MCEQLPIQNWAQTIHARAISTLSITLKNIYYYHHALQDCCLENHIVVHFLFGCFSNVSVIWYNQFKSWSTPQISGSFRVNLAILNKGDIQNVGNTLV